MVGVYSLCTVVNRDDAALSQVNAVADTASPPSQDFTDADVAVAASEAEVVAAVAISVEQQPSHDSTKSSAPDCSTSANAAVALSPTASATVPQELQDITPTLLLSPKSFHSKAVVRVADLSPLPSLSVTEKNKKRKSRTSKATDLTSTPYKKELESLPVNVRKATVRRKLNTGSAAECVGHNKVQKMTDHGGQKKQKRIQHPKTTVAVGDFPPIGLHVGVNNQLVSPEVVSPGETMTAVAISVEQQPSKKVKSRKSRTSEAADLTSRPTPYKKELESLPVSVRTATVRRKLNTGSAAVCVGNNKVQKMTDHGGQKKQIRIQHPKRTVAVGDFPPLHVGVNNQLVSPEVVSPGETMTAVAISVEQQPSHDSTKSSAPDCSTSANAAVALSPTAATVPRELQDITPTLLLSPKSFYGKAVVNVADLSPLPSLSVTKKSKKRKSRTSKAYW